ncbi:MAG: hypothetical protein WCQ48_00820 [Chloroflexota bacterium]
MLDDVITAALAGDCMRLRSLVLGRDEPCAVPTGPSRIPACDAGVPSGTPVRTFYAGNCQVNGYRVGAADTFAASFIADITGFAGVLQRGPTTGDQLSAGEFYLAFHSKAYGMHLIAMDGAGAVGFFATQCYDTGGTFQGLTDAFVKRGASVRFVP